MSDVRTWFEKELQRLGFAGLEGVYDYLSSMSESECINYLHSLLGSEPEIQNFASSYVSNRASGRPQQSQHTASPGPLSNDSLTTWASSGAASSSSASKKAKKSRGKGRSNATSKAQGSKEEKPSFANAVTHHRASASNSKQMQAIRNSPVEVARQKVREYRQAGRPVNCIKCGKIEMMVREDGACSFCGAALFAIWEQEEDQIGKRGQDIEEMTRRRRATIAEPVPVVLGRYTFRGDVGGKGLERRVKDIAGNHIHNEGEKPQKDKSGNKGGTGLYRNPMINEKDLEEVCRFAESFLKKLNTRGTASDNDLLRPCGRIQIDDLAPSVNVQTD